MLLPVIKLSLRVKLAALGPANADAPHKRTADELFVSTMLLIMHVRVWINNQRSLALIDD